MRDASDGPSVAEGERPILYTTTELNPDGAQDLPFSPTVLHVFRARLVSRLPLDEEQPHIGFDGRQLCLLPGGGAKPYVPPAVRRDRLSRHSMIARACGVAELGGQEVLDATAGWGTDGLTLQGLGVLVQMVERNPAVWALLTQRASSAVLGDGFEWIGSRRWPVIYLDPMFAPRGRKGLAKQPLQMLSLLADQDGPDVADWVAHARAWADQRVVLKQRLKAPLVGRPDWQIKGRSVRFDVYRPATQRAGTPTE